MKLSKKLVILGAQWGDEGKGKIVDLLSADYEVVVRYQGGSNAGHTVMVNGQKFILHLLPTGILHTHTVGVIAQGMVVDLELLVEEIKDIESKGISVKDRLLISERAHLVLPYHKTLDALLEKKGKIGTTLRGIGPAYMLKHARKGIRVCDLWDKDRFYSLVKDNLELVEELCKKVYCESFEMKAEEVVEKTLENFEYIKHCVADASNYLLNTKKSILFEGAQGVLLDVDIGTYPYVTSSNSSALGLSAGTGLPPKFFSDAEFLGVSKAYATRVGEGPFPTELKDETGQLLRERGGEYGATTGRPRRCGWLDLVALRHAVNLNGLDGIVLTKLDVLDSFEEIKVCVAYKIEDKVVDTFPASVSLLEKAQPIYKSFEGWRKDTHGATSPEDLPEQALSYLRFIQEFTGVPVVMLSTSPERDKYIWLSYEERVGSSNIG
ncbi:adenylosuccinate synthase [Thermocrinis sp.]